MFRFLILGFLRNRSPMHGYALFKRYRERSGADVSTGNFYRELQRLVTAGLVQSVANPVQADARRAPYAITECGKRIFDEWFTADVSPESFSEDEISARILFIADVDTGDVVKFLDGMRQSLWAWSKRLERERQAALTHSQDSDTPDRPILPLLLARRIRHVAVDLDIIAELRLSYATPAALPAAPVAEPVASPPPPSTAIQRRRTARAAAGLVRRARATS
jgi:DNA-binding PadR family transcriptional regulator